MSISSLCNSHILVEQFAKPFQSHTLQHQPKYVVEVLFDSEPFLPQLYDYIVHNTYRGQHLHDLPVALVAATMKDTLLTKVREALPASHALLILPADRPEMLRAAFHEHHIDEDDVLLICGPIDFPQLCCHPIRPSLSATFSGFRCQSDICMLLRTLVQHLVGWEACTGTHGLSLIQSHCSSTTELSSGYIPPHLWVLCAAAAGLIGERFSLLPPSSAAAEPVAQLTFNHFVRKRYHIQLAQLADAPAMVRFATRICAPICPSLKTIETLIQKFPSLQLVAWQGSEMLAWGVGQRVADADFPTGTTAEGITDLGVDDGPYIQLLIVFAKPNQTETNDIMRFVLQYYALQPGARAIVAITRFSAFHTRGQGMTPEQYLRS
eukprot:EG_transcript_16563